jgi:hypothetical protein
LVAIELGKWSNVYNHVKCAYEACVITSIDHAAKTVFMPLNIGNSSPTSSGMSWQEYVAQP